MKIAEYFEAVKERLFLASFVTGFRIEVIPGKQINVFGVLDEIGKVFKKSR
jgi:hypothetical protein